MANFHVQLGARWESREVYRHSALTHLILSIAVLIAAISAAQSNPAQSNNALLRPGMSFPQCKGSTLTGKMLELPAAAAGTPAVVVFSFSRAAGKDARLWNEHLMASSSDALRSYDVIELESVPKLFRGLALSGIRNDMPARLQDRSIVLYQDEKLWKLRLSVSDSSRAFVVLMGPDGRIRWNNTGAYTDAEFLQLKNAINITVPTPMRRQ